MIPIVVSGIVVATGGVLILASANRAIDAYQRTDITVGPEESLDNLEDIPFSEKEWLYLLILNYNDWMDDNWRVNDEDSEIVSDAQRYFKGGVIMVFAGAILYLGVVISYTITTTVGMI